MPIPPDCEWCKEPYLNWNDDPDTDKLCRTHLAEYEGLSESELDRRDDEEARELL